MKHKRSGKLYKTWHRMILRCHDPMNDRYGWYGARGIDVCARWRGSFDAFAEDLGQPPTPLHTIDRRDNDRGYWCGHQDCPECAGRQGNVRWATWREQGNNRSTNVTIEYGEKKQTMAQWARDLGVDRRVLFKRLAAGWSVHDALTRAKAPRTKRRPDAAPRMAA